MGGLTWSQAAQHWVGVGDRVVAWTNSAPADRVRLGVRDEGVYCVTAKEFASAAGVSETTALTALNTSGVSLTCQGRPVAWTTDGDALYFYGVPTKELFAPENVYWLAAGQGTLMQTQIATPDAAAATNAWFMHAESYRSAFLAPYDPRDRRSSNGTLTNVLNFGEWVQSATSKAKTVTLPGFCDGTETGVMARVSLVSYKDFTSPDLHACEIWLNGTSCGSQGWSGEQAVVFDYAAPVGAVNTTSTEIRVSNMLASSGPSDFMLLDPTLIYPRLYRAQGGVLLCTGGKEQTVAVDGFGSSLIRVWDVTAPAAPVEFVASVWQGTNAQWRVAFACGDKDARYAVFDEAAGTNAPSVCGVSDTDWSDPVQMPEFAIVVPPRRWISGFAAAVQPLADFRNAQGLRTRVIYADEIYDAFSDGLVHPAAFQRFSAAGVTNGAAPVLRYMLFAGYGGTDYKLEVFKPGEAGLYPALFPLYQIQQTDSVTFGALMLPNDPVLGNAVGNAAPEVAVGRFLATSAVELSRMVTKTIRYELAATWKKKAVFAACKQLPTDNVTDPLFSNIVAQTSASYATGGWTTEAFYPAPPNDAMNVMWTSTSYTRSALAELAEGAGFFYYFGHSNDPRLGTTSDASNTYITATKLTEGTWSFAPVALLMGCRIGRWTTLDLKTQARCVAEAGVRNPTSGFTAVISAAGYLQTYEALYFSNGFRDQIVAGALRLGDAWCGAFASLSDMTAANIQHMSLLGDPSLCIRAGSAAHGTSTAWLIAHGLTGDPYAELSDQDGDGFATWQEYQAGTSPVQGGLRLRNLTLPGKGATGLPLAFEPLSGLNYRVLSTTNLASGVWAPLPWRLNSGADWSESGISGDWPLKAVEVPYDGSDLLRFYKVESY